jgi:hypothetical protein
MQENFDIEVSKSIDGKDGKVHLIYSVSQVNY